MSFTPKIQAVLLALVALLLSVLHVYALAPRADMFQPLSKRVDPVTTMQEMEDLRTSLSGNKKPKPVPTERKPKTNAFTEQMTAAAVKAVQSEGVEPSAGCTACVSSLTFAGEAAKKYAVGTQIPTLPFKTKNAWAGNIPIAQNANSSLFFFLWGKDAKTAGDEVVIWLNGGPGCSSFVGMVQEIGPFLYMNVSEKPYPNPYSWTRAATMLFVEQPVGTGFATGPVTNTNEDQVAEQFASFLDNFFTIFSELRGKKLYIAGESFAGIYITNIMDYLYRQGNKHNLQGSIIIDGLISIDTTQVDLVIYKFAQKNQKIMGLLDSDLEEIKVKSDSCNLTGYADMYLHYPPKGKLPPHNPDGCDTWGHFFSLALKRNYKFNVFRITTPTRKFVSPLGDGNSNNQSQFKTFFDNAELQKYINAPAGKWNECNQVFANGNGRRDLSPPPDRKPSFESNILASVIERSKAGMIIMQGDQDARILTDGTSIVLQNLTWNNVQGFSKPPSKILIDIDGRETGKFITERGLTYAIIPEAGHQVTFDAQGTGLAAIEVLLGRRTFAGPLKG